ncbi:hypothetical protein GCM10011611_09710 [Aliidongia dinghuensis]|uniref:Uncharacterized protein n=1 Tax=Aliidongia dinghuensis TaxID=1867774 RepID=A0A8J3E226_9PROT|nr:hypothetical protein GCM10011611_09710 [Aliidongia dinghuensis]
MVAELERQRLGIVRPVPPRRQHRHEREIGADIDELVAHRLQHMTADIGPVERRVEAVRIILQADAQLARGVGRRRGAGESRQRQAAKKRRRPTPKHAVRARPGTDGSPP